MANRGPPDFITNGLQAAVLEWIRSLDLELVSILLARSWPLSILDSSEPRWRPVEVTDTDNVVRQDRRQRLLRWDRRPPNEIFLNGFVPIVTREYPDWEETDLYGFAKSNHPSFFVSTTKTQRNKKNKKKYVWTPRSANRGIVYQYEIYAPGGVDVNESLSHESPWPNQMEVAFPGGIQNIYIRSARELQDGRIQRIWINPNFLDPGELEPIASSSRTPNVIWSENHPDGNHKDSESRSKRSASFNDDLMYGGAGGVEEETFGDEIDNPKPFPDGEFTIESINDNNFFLDLTQNVSGGIIHSHIYNGGENQIWVLSYDENKKGYKIKSKQNPSLLLSWNSNDTSREKILRGYTESGSKNQYWRIEQKNEYFRFRNLENSPMIITVENKTSNYGGKEITVQTEAGDESNSQVWKIKPMSYQPVASGDYYMFNRDLLDKVVDFSNQEDSLVHGHTFMDNDNQKWNFTYDSGKQAYKIRSGRKTNLFLSWNASSNEMVLRGFTESGNKDQYWRIERTADESYRFRNLENLSLIMMLSKEDSPYGGLNLIVHDSNDDSNFYSYWKIKPIFYQYIPDGDYHIFNHNFPNTLIDYTNQEGALVHGHNYFGNNNQKWSFVFDGNQKAYKIKSGVNSDLLLTWDSNVASKEMVLRAYTENKNMSQYWRLDKLNNGSYKIKNQNDYEKEIAITNNDSPYGGRELLVSSSVESGNNWYFKRVGEVALPNGKFRIATKLNYKKVIDFDHKYNLIIIDNLNLATSEWEINYDSNYKAYNIHSADTLNIGWIYQNKNFFVKVDNIDGPDSRDARYYWTIEYSIQHGCYMIRSYHEPSHAVGYSDNNSLVTDTSTYSDNQLFHFIPLNK